MTTETTQPKTDAAKARAFNALPWSEKPAYDAKPSDLAQAAARHDLRATLKPGTVVYATLEGPVSASGMTRHLRLFVIRKGRLQNITAQAARAMGERCHDRNGNRTLKVNGCGMDMAFHTVYGLGRALYPKGFKSTARAPARAGEPRESDGGYAFKSEWI